MALKVGDAAGLLEREDEAEGQAEQVQAVESTPAPDDGDVGGAVAELRAQVAELDRSEAAYRKTWTPCWTWSPSSCRAARG